MHHLSLYFNKDSEKAAQLSEMLLSERKVKVSESIRLKTNK